MLAGELALAGVGVTVLERLPEPTGQSRAPGVYAGTLRYWDQRDLLRRFGDRLRVGAHGHFALLPGGLDLGVLDTPRAAALVPQATVEEVLLRWARDLGAVVRRGHEVTGLDAGPDGVELAVSGPDGPYALRASHVVGCDGGRSAVRDLAGFAFPGTPATVDVLLADVAGLAPEDVPLPRDPFPFLRTERGWVGLSVVAPGSVRLFACDFARPPVRGAGPPSFAEVAAAVRDLSGVDISAGTPLWVSRFGNTTRQVDALRRGRVLLAGDAAHVHPPFGGQGIGLGIADAVNLGWKLAARVRGWAPPDLLNSYDAERGPAAARVLALTRAQDALMQGGAGVASLRDFVADLAALPEANRRLAAEVTGLTLRHDVGEDGPLPGRLVPHRELTAPDGTPTTTSALLRRGRGVLVDLDGRHADAAAPWRDRVDTVAARGAVEGAPALLLRPDGHVAWAGAGSPERALRRWFGEPLTGPPLTDRTAPSRAVATEGAR
ncbi:monooxygenase [Saccharothrix syringae]|uniref:Monooxygenase n=2 Tax=Saccharothrix syringae TaxID=103733 RepID=A0A5Q0HDT7_SACSY|nr:monooxygenase [Saccharothrix syringae]